MSAAASEAAATVAASLRAGGFLAADEEAVELVDRAHGDAALLEQLLARRLAGEPLAWITGHSVFCGVRLQADHGVYVPRPHTEVIARRAAERLPGDGVAVDVCTGSGAVAALLTHERTGARVVATDIDAGAVACARRNGVDAVVGDLFAPVPEVLSGYVDVVVGVVPYVPTAEMDYMQRDTFTFETPLAYDGGADGTLVLRRVIRESPRWLRRGGALVLELGGSQSELLRDELAACGFAAVRVLRDEDGDVRGVEATLS